MEKVGLEIDSAIGAINQKIISAPRLVLLRALLAYGPDGISFRELQKSVDFPDGVIFSNLKILEEMGLVKSEEVTVAGKALTSYAITLHGKQEFIEAKKWLIGVLG